MEQIAVIANGGGTRLDDSSQIFTDYSSPLFRRMNRAAHISALAIFIRNFPLEVFDSEERSWFLGIQSRVCLMESNAFDDLGME